MNKQPILSLCMPTNGREEWVVPTIKSIFNQNVDNRLFEVVICDNGNGETLEKEMKHFDYPNLRYYRTEAVGFMNQIDCLEKGSGLFCKMINHRGLFRKGVLEKWIMLIKNQIKEKPVIYFSNGLIGDHSLVHCENTDEFVKYLNFACTWSAGLGIWNIDKPSLSTIKYNTLFPHASILFQHRKQTKYLIYDDTDIVQQSNSGKGGYDLFNAFAIVFLDIINDLRIQNRITNHTFIFVKKKLFRFLLNQFYAEVLLPSDHTFIINDVKSSIMIYYSRYDYYYMCISQRLRLLMFPVAYLKNTLFCKTK